MANPVTPTKNGNRYRFAWGDVVLEIDAAAGARVAKLSLGGADLIVARSRRRPIRPPGARCSGPARAARWTPADVAAAGEDRQRDLHRQHLRGRTSWSTGPADTSIGVSMAKDYSADATSGWIKIEYTINATKAQKAAPWEVSRVPRGGHRLLPRAGRRRSPTGPLTITQQARAEIVWFDDAAEDRDQPERRQAATPTAPAAGKPTS